MQLKSRYTGIKYEREKAPKRNFTEPDLKEPKDYANAVLSVLRHPNVASKAKAYKHYDTSVMAMQ